MLRAVIFDFDGTLADTVSAIREGVNLTMRKYGFAEHTHDQIRSYINNGARMLIKRAMPSEEREDEALVDRVLADYDELYGTVYMHTDRAYDGVAELIGELHRSGLRIGVLSNKQDLFVKRLAEQVLLPNSFDAAQGVIAGQPTKPHPYLAGRLFEALGVSPEECVMVGDSDVDILTAKAAGMRHIGVSWGFRTREQLLASGATAVADTPRELRRMLLAMQA